VKKFSVLLLILAALLALNGLVFAGDVEPQFMWPSRPLNGMYFPPFGKGPERLRGTFQVIGDVGPYAAIDIKNDKLFLGFTGYENEREEAYGFFDIKSNTNVGLRMDFLPLRQGLFGDTIKTDVTVYRSRLPLLPYFPPIWDEVLKDDAHLWNIGFDANSYVQGKEHRQYMLVVGGTLGDIHHQAEGSYGTSIVLTVFKP
jgi:hypothetical protein